MSDHHFISDIAFTPEVKEEQEKQASRAHYQAFAEARDWQDHVNDDLRERLAETNSFYLATVGSEGHPYIQHRGGPKGFLLPLDDKRLAFADFSGNRQYISLGNVKTNNKAHIFMMDYANKRRVKMWGYIEAVEPTAELVAKLTHPDYGATIERVFIFTLAAWDKNCPQHIPQKVDKSEAERVVAYLQQRIQTLEDENAELRAFVK